MIKRSLLFSAILFSETVLSHSAGAIGMTPALNRLKVEGANGIFELGGNQYGFDINSTPDSVFSYGEGTADDYNLLIKEAVGNGAIIDKYYKINLKPETFSSSASINWIEVGENQKDNKDDDLSDSQISGISAVVLPNEQIKYFQYTYTKPTNYTETNTRIDNTLTAAGTDNKVFNGVSSTLGNGAVYNKNDHKDINIAADFIGNYKESRFGSAIYNNSGGFIGDITGNFIDNYANSQGGAIYNYGTVGNVSGNFIANYTRSAGGAIANQRTMGNISGNFIGNFANSSGGAILTLRTVGNITGNFIGNYVKGPGYEVWGGAIYSGGIVGNITGDFIGNYIQNNDNTTKGGAIYNTGTIASITGNFINNFAEAKMGAKGGAINNNESDIGNIASNLIYGNKAISAEGYAYGGFFYKNRLYSTGQDPIENNIIGNIIGNEAQGKTAAAGGAIYNEAGTILSGQGYEIDWNPDYGVGPWWFKRNDHTITQSSLNFKDSIFINNKAIADNGDAKGGAIANIINFSVEVRNYDESMIAPEIMYKDNISVDEWNQMSNEEKMEAIKNYMGTIESYTDNLVEALQVSGAVIKNALNLTNVSFIVNSAEGSNEAKGGAIYSEDNVNIRADGATSLFRGNTANGKNNAIYMAFPTLKFEDNLLAVNPLSSILALSLSAVNGGIIAMDDGIDGDAGYKIALSGDASGSINFGGLISNASEVVSSDVTVNFNKGQEGLVYNQQSGITNLNAAFNNSSLTVGALSSSISSKASSQTVMNIADGSYLNGNNSLTVNSGMVNIGNLDNNLHFNKLSMTGGSLNIENVGVDLATQVMGSLSADSYDHQSGTIAVKNVNVTADGSVGTTTVNFTDSLIADKVVNQVTEAMGPVYKYDVAYNPSTGEFEFSRPETPGGDDVNPEVMAPVVAAASTVAVLNDEIYSRVLNDVDSLGSSTPHVSSSDRSIKNAWVKTFGSKDSVDLKNFRGADTKFYGLIGGLSSDRINEGQGWSAIYSVYGAYAGGEQKFAGEKVTNNGGYLGLGANFYNGDFFIGTTINGGLIRNRSDKTGVDGKDKFNSYVGGIAAKSGYDYHIGSFTVEPNVYASYTVIGADDYMTKSGVKVDFGTMSVIEAAPGLKLAQEFGEGLKGYVSGRYVWTFTEGDHVKANQFDLPDVELEDYAEYGIGLEKNWDASSGFVEVKRRDGGRNGWNFTAGYKSAF